MMTIDQQLCIRCGSCVKVCPMGIFQKNEDGQITVQQRGCIDCLHCAAACPTRAIGHSELGREACYAQPAEAGTLLSLLQRRRSIRHFKPDTPDPALIRAALEGAQYAPSAKNQRVCSWTVVSGAAKVAELCQLALAYARTQPELRHLVWLHRHGMDPVTCGAPCLVLAHSPEDSHSPQIDAAVAAALVEQLLAERGLGACWGGYLCRMIGQSPELQAAVDLPEGHRVYAVLMVGAPDERYPNIPARPAADITWIS